MNIHNKMFKLIPIHEFPNLKPGDTLSVTCTLNNNRKFIHKSGIVWNTQENKTNHSFTIMLPSDDETSGIMQIRYRPDQKIICAYMIPLHFTGTSGQKQKPDVIHGDITLERVIGFTVDTPHGTLKAYDNCNDEYPGICVDLINTDPTKDDITLNWTEYIPGGEGICDFNPNPTYQDKIEIERQRQEVPNERTTTNEYGRTCVSAGFVTRAWPNETESEDFHIRTFHFGYPTEEDQHHVQ